MGRELTQEERPRNCVVVILSHVLSWIVPGLRLAGDVPVEGVSVEGVSVGDVPVGQFKP